MHQFLIPVFWFAAKVGFLLFTFIWVRATLPRFRYDQLMRFAWKFFFPRLYQPADHRFPGRAHGEIAMDIFFFLLFALIAVACAINLVCRRIRSRARFR